MKKYNVAVVGATGLVGRKMLQVLQERDFPVDRLLPLTSAASAGRTLFFGENEVMIEELTRESFADIHFALFSAGGDISTTFAPVAAAEGAIVIDNSSAWRMDKKVPLIVPEVNAQALKEHSGIVANPNCSTIQMVVALQPLRAFGLRRIVVSTYQGVTGSGKKAVEQLQSERSGESASEPAYPHPIANNCLPHIDRFFDDGYTREEHKMIDETRKIMDLPQLLISPTCARIPVTGGHSESINIEFDKSFKMTDVRSALENAPGIVVVDSPTDNRYPMPIEAADSDAVFVGRLRRDASLPNGLNMWVVSDNLRKGAATNTVQIAETMIKHNLVVSNTNRQRTSTTMESRQ